MITLRDQLGDEAYIKYLERELAKAKAEAKHTVEKVKTYCTTQMDPMGEDFSPGRRGSYEEW